MTLRWRGVRDAWYRKPMAKEAANVFEKVVALAKRRGFVYPGSEIYGGLAGFYDWGPLGVELKFNIKQAWWQDVVRRRDDVVGLSAAIIMNPRAWEASGHVSGFADILVECKKCNKRFRIEDYEEVKARASKIPGLSDKSYELGIEIKGDVVCKNCGAKGTLTNFRKFNTMFKTFVGSIEDASAIAYLRPETAGGIFVNFKNVLATNRLKIPFGIAQIGKAFRNEINPRDFVFRTREFEQMELEYFVKPGEDEEKFKEWVKERFVWYKSIGLKNVRLREQEKGERAHYSKATTDIEYEFPFGWQEIEGVANRGNFDLQAHTKGSGADLTYFDEEAKERYLPYVIEPSAGVERIALALLCEAYTEEPASAEASDGQEKSRVVMKFHPKIAPVKAAVFPLLANKPDLVEKARGIYEELRENPPAGGAVAWDDRGNIGKRYLSQDEIGTPYCITVDFESLEDDAVTVRDRDSMRQVRIKVKDLATYLRENLKS